MMPGPIRAVAVALAPWIVAPLAHAGGCCTPAGTPGCGEASCESLVCFIDDFCCATEWDQSCADLAEGVCTACGGAGTFIGACCLPNGGCAQTSPLECGASSGAVFAGFGTLCVDLVCPPPCAADIDADGDTDSADLNTLLAGFGTAVQPDTAGDLDGDGVIDSADLNLLLADFGCTR